MASFQLLNTTRLYDKKGNYGAAGTSCEAITSYYMKVLNLLEVTRCGVRYS